MHNITISTAGNAAPHSENVHDVVSPPIQKRHKSVHSNNDEQLMVEDVHQETTTHPPATIKRSKRQQEQSHAAPSTKRSTLVHGQLCKFAHTKQQFHKRQKDAMKHRSKLLMQGYTYFCVDQRCRGYMHQSTPGSRKRTLQRIQQQVYTQARLHESMPTATKGLRKKNHKATQQTKKQVWVPLSYIALIKRVPHFLPKEKSHMQNQVEFNA